MEVKSTAEQLFFITVRIDTVDPKGNAGAGTGFIFVHSYKENNYPFIVTNKHVIKDTVKGGLTFIKKEGDTAKLGDAFRLEVNNFEGIWFGHKDPKIDIAVAPLAPLVNGRLKLSHFRS